MNERKNIQYYPGHMHKTKREISEIISNVDIVIEVVDSRIPFSSRIPDLKKLINGKQSIIHGYIIRYPRHISHNNIES